MMPSVCHYEKLKQTHAETDITDVIANNCTLKRSMSVLIRRIRIYADIQIDLHYAEIQIDLHYADTQIDLHYADI